jgi:hypothetical protein
MWDEADRPDVVQVWFAGVHPDVGGSYEERGLSDIALQWMLENAQQRGLRLADNWQQQLDPDPLGVIHESRRMLWRLWRPVILQVFPSACKITTAIHRPCQLTTRNGPSRTSTLPARERCRTGGHGRTMTWISASSASGWALLVPSRAASKLSWRCSRMARPRLPNAGIRLRWIRD